MVDPSKIWNSSRLPSLPTVAMRLLELSKEPEAEIKSVIEIIKTDPAISAKILKITNSSFFGFSTDVTSIDGAVVRLGTNVVTSLALTFSLDQAAMGNGCMVEHYRAYWTQSLLQGVTADLLGKHSGYKDPTCEHFLAGLLADLGRLAMLKTIPKDYRAVLAAAKEEKQSLHRVESELLGISHVEVGVKLMQNWQLSQALIAAAQYHHASVDELKQQCDAEMFELIKATAVASAVGEYFCAEDKGFALEHLRAVAGEFYGFSENQLSEFLNMAKAEVDDAGDLFAVDTETLADPADLLAQANEHLAEFALRRYVASTEAAARQQAMEREKRELEAINKQLQQQAIRDPLTQVYNRNFFEEAFGRDVEHCCRTASPLGVIFVDIDRFKQINDTYGHPFADRVLQRVANVLTRMVRKADVLARYGGDEFMVLIHRPTEKGLATVAERVRARVESEQIEFEDERVSVTVSVGAAVALPRRWEADLGTRLFAAADEAMYDSKRNGRNQVHLRSLINEDDRRITQTVTARRFSRWLVRRRVINIAGASKALRNSMPRRVRIGDLAKQRGYLNESQVEQILHELDRTGERFGETAMRLGFMTEDHLTHLLALQMEDPIEVARSLVQLGLLSRQEVVARLKEYLAQTSPQPSDPSSDLIQLGWGKPSVADSSGENRDSLQQPCLGGNAPLPD